MNKEGALDFFIHLFTDYLLQAACSFGMILLFGLACWAFNRAFYRLLGGAGRTVCLLTGCIGTPVHEASHALMCLLFGHRIDEIKLYQIDSDDGTLGYVRHSYNPRNLWARIGCFFIGIAPVIVGAGVLLLLAWLLLPELIAQIGAVTAAGNGIWQTAADVVVAFFSYYNRPLWWLFLLLGGLIAIHMNLSAADRKGALPGLAVSLVVLLLVDVVLVSVDAVFKTDALAAVSAGFTAFAYMLTVVMLFTAAFAAALLLFAALVRLLRRR